MLKTSTVLPYAQRPGEKCGLGTTLRTRGDGESASVNPRVLTLRDPVCDRGSPHFSPGAELARRGQAWRRIFSFSACSRPKSVAGHYVRGSMCALKGKRQARTRPAPCVTANLQNSTNKLLKTNGLYRMYPATRREMRASSQPKPGRVLWLERSGQLWNGFSIPGWRGWLPPGACPCRLPKRCRPDS